MAEDKETKLNEDDRAFIANSTSTIINLLSCIADSRYPYKKAGYKNILFLRNILMNLLGNFVVSLSANLEDLDKNIELSIEDIREWYKVAREDFDKHKKGVN